MLRLGRGLANLTVGRADVDWVRPPCHSGEPANEHGVGKRQSRLALRGQFGPGYNRSRASARHKRPAASAPMVNGDPMRLSGETAIVTGAAHGIGKAIAEL